MQQRHQEEGFFQKVYQIVAHIPYGKVTTYGAIAEALGSKGAARMVGWALNSKKYHLDDLPAHRVVNRKGIISGKRHFGGPNTMKKLLENEGLTFDGDQIVHFDRHFWHPGK